MDSHHKLYSQITKTIDENTNANIAQRYVELFYLVKGKKVESGNSKTEPEKQNEKTKRRVKRPKTTVSSNNTSSTNLSVPSTSPETLLSKQPNATSQAEVDAENFAKWLKKKNAEIRKDKKMAQLEQLQKAMAEAKKVAAKQERLKVSKVAYAEWVEKKQREVERELAKREASRIISDDIVHAKEEARCESLATELSSMPANLKSKNDENVHFPEVAQRKVSSKIAPKSSAEPVVSKSGKVVPVAQKDVEQNELPGKTETTGSTNLKKSITYEEWLMNHKTTSSSQKLATKKDRDEISFLLKDLTDAKMPARKRVETLLGPEKKPVNITQPTVNRDTELPTSPSKRFSDDKLRKVAATTHTWDSTSTRKKANLFQTTNESSAKNRPKRPASAFATTSYSSPRKEELFRSSTPHISEISEKATAALDAPDIVRDTEVFGLTALSASFDNVSLF